MRNITESDFTLTRTANGYTVRWKHNNRAIRSVRGTDARKRAIGFIDFLVKWYASEGYKIDSEGYTEKSRVK